jgi:hypothetical protein
MEAVSWEGQNMGMSEPGDGNGKGGKELDYIRAGSQFKRRQEWGDSKAHAQ